MFLSFVIPVYNREKLIKRCLDSILCQNLDDIEIICVDDASEDGTVEVIREYQEKNTNVRMMVNEENRGQAFTRNRGMESAKGDYIWFVDSDDYISSDSIGSLRECCDEQKPDVVCFDMLKISDRGEAVDRIGLKNSGKIMKGEEIFCELSKIRSVKASVCQQLYSRDYLKEAELKFTVGYIAEDAFFALKSLVLAPKVLYINKAFYISQLSDNSTCKYAKERDYFKGIFMAYCDIWQFWQSRKWLPEVSENLISYMMTRYRYAARYYHPKIFKEIDEWVEEQNETVKYLYFIFKEQNRGYYVNKISDKNRKKIEEAESIYVFGAGQIADETAVILNQMRKIILAYIVSDYTFENPRAIYGVPVMRAGDLKNIDKNALVIVAAAPRYYEGIVETLKLYGLNNNVLKIVE